MSHDDACWDAGIGGNGLVSGIAGDDTGMRMAHHASEDEGRGSISVLRRKLGEAG